MCLFFVQATALVRTPKNKHSVMLFRGLKQRTFVTCKILLRKPTFTIIVLPPGEGGQAIKHQMVLINKDRAKSFILGNKFHNSLEKAARHVQAPLEDERVIKPTLRAYGKM